jgi:hypothetical protein
VQLAQNPSLWRSDNKEEVAMATEEEEEDKPLEREGVKMTGRTDLRPLFTAKSLTLYSLLVAQPED